MIYYTSDWHLNDDRIGINDKPNLFYRPFSSVEEQNSTILTNFVNSDFKDGDTLIHLGDVFYGDITQEDMDNLIAIKELYPTSTFFLIEGNYDEGKHDMLKQFFDGISTERVVRNVYLNHYPENCIDYDRAITGHIHGLWKVQKNMINVGVDAWHFRPVSQDTIDFCFNAMDNHYDYNVFPY